MIEIYTDGACQRNPGPGGWAAIILSDGRKRALQGHEATATNNRMELMAAIKGLEATLDGAQVTLYSDSQYLVNTMTRGWKRRANLDLWKQLDGLARSRKVTWLWVQGHGDNAWNLEVDRLARAAIRQATKGVNLWNRLLGLEEGERVNRPHPKKPRRSG